MTYRSRALLFYILVAVFILGGALVVFYSQGWRLDTRTGTPTKVGALYVRTLPQDASLALDGEPIENKAWFLREGTLMDSLFPQTYELNVEMEGFRPWHQTLDVQPSLVTERKFVVLVPEEATPLTGTTSTQAFWLLPDTTIVRKTAMNSLVAAGGTLPGNEVVAWSENGQYILTRSVATNDRILIDVRRGTTSTLPRRLGNQLDTRNQGVQFAVTNAGDIAAHSSSTLVVANLRDRTSRLVSSYPKPLAIGEVAIDAPANSLAWSTYNANTKEARLIVSTLTTPIQTNTVALPAQIRTMSWITGGRLALLDTRGSLSVYDPGRSQTNEIAHSIQGLFSWSPDNEVVVVRGAGYVEAIPLDDEREGVRISLEDAGRIQRFEWYEDLHHIFAVYPDRVDFLETDPGAEQTVFTVHDGGGTGVAYDPESNVLYALTGSQLLTFAFPNR